MRKIILIAVLLVFCGSSLSTASASTLDDICFPLVAGYSWTYSRQVEVNRGEGFKIVKIDTIQIDILHNITINDRVYVSLNDGRIFRMSIDGKVWQYDSNLNKDMLFSDLGIMSIDYQDDIKIYDGFFQEESVAIKRLKMTNSIIISSISYSPIFHFSIQTGEGGVVANYIPEIGVVESSDSTWERREYRKLIQYRHGNITTIIDNNSWGRLKQSLERVPK
jgi:hypothetical protein